MIVAGGRLFLWKNNISDESKVELSIKIGEGGKAGNSNEISINNENLNSPISSKTINIQYSPEELDPGDDNWSNNIVNFNKYIDSKTRKITFFVKIQSDTSGYVRFGEIGLFAKDKDTGVETMISHNLIQKQHTSTSEAKIIKYTINI